MLNLVIKLFSVKAISTYLKNSQALNICFHSFYLSVFICNLNFSYSLRNIFFKKVHKPLEIYKFKHFYLNYLLIFYWNFNKNFLNIPSYMITLFDIQCIRIISFLCQKNKKQLSFHERFLIFCLDYCWNYLLSCIKLNSTILIFFQST